MMSDLEKAIRNIEDTLSNTDTMRIKQSELTKDEIIKIYYEIGKKRNFSLSYIPKTRSEKKYVLNTSTDVLTQWQTITYYYMVAKTSFHNDLYLTFFGDLDLLVTKDYSKIDDFHETCALVQIPDLPYEDTEHINFYIDEQGNYSYQIEDILEFVKEKIELGYYVAIELDTFFVEPASQLHRALRHFIYGYDDEKQQLFCKGFINKVFSTYKLNYRDFILAYEYCKIINIKAPVFLELYKHRDYKGTKREFKKSDGIERLYSYFAGNNNYQILQDESKKGRWENCAEYVGKKASDKLISLLGKMNDGKAEICYQCIHAFYENKMMLLERCRYYLGQRRIEWMEEVLRNANLARYQFMKYELSRKRGLLENCIDACSKCSELEEKYFRGFFS